MTITIQTSYQLGANAFPGMIAGGGATATRSATLDYGSGFLSFGHAAFFSANEGRCITIPASGKFAGIAVSDSGTVEAAPPGFNTADTYSELQSVSLLYRGGVYVIAGANVRKDDPAYVTAGSAYGAFTNVAGGNIAIPATFMQAASAGSLVLLRVTG